MGKYGDASVQALMYFKDNSALTIREAWEKAVEDKFPKSLSGQRKGCPKGTFLGLCEDGWVAGVAPGSYTSSKLNKMYGLKAIEHLRRDSRLAFDNSALWTLVLDGMQKAQNHQMDVVISLWRAGLICSTKK